MNHRLLLKLCLIITLGIIALFYLLNTLTSHTEEGMSYIALEDRATINAWGQQAETLYLAGNKKALDDWLTKLETEEDTQVTIARSHVEYVAGNKDNRRLYEGNTLGRSVDWKIHLYFSLNPMMEVRFKTNGMSFLVSLPDRMRPGFYWKYAKVTMQLIIPAILLIFLSYLLYLYIMKPLGQLKTATRAFSQGNFDIRAKKLMGHRNDEFYELAKAFDQMATQIGEQIISQRQLIADLSHELRTPLTRLDIALVQEKESNPNSKHIDRISRESQQIRTLVEDSLSLAWLENEKPELNQESVELVDLLDVLVSDASFEFPDKNIDCQFPDSALITHSSHRAAGQAIENILRNALRYTPSGKSVFIEIKEQTQSYLVTIKDQGIGVPDKYLKAIFKPFFRVDRSRQSNKNSFGLGLALAKRQLAAIDADVVAKNAETGGLLMVISFPK